MSQLNRHQLNQHKSHPVNQRWGSGKHPRCEGCQSWPEVDPYSPTPFQFGESQTTEAPSGRRKQWVGTQNRKGDGKRERGSSLMGRGGPLWSKGCQSSGTSWDRHLSALEVFHRVTLDCAAPCASASPRPVLPWTQPYRYPPCSGWAPASLGCCAEWTYPDKAA